MKNKEFNPTRKDLLNLEQLILDAKAKKDNLIKTKISLQNSLSESKKRYKEVEFESEEFNEVKEKRSKLKKAVSQIEIKIKNINEELIVKNKMKNEVVFHLKHNKSLEGKEDLEKITNKINLLINKYSEFTRDRTRISSLRIMASEFQEELKKLLND